MDDRPASRRTFDAANDQIGPRLGQVTRTEGSAELLAPLADSMAARSERMA